MGTTLTFMTADEFLTHRDGRLSELVRGKVVPLNVPAPRHGQICLQIAFMIKQYLAENDVAHVVTNDTGIITQRDPDTIRGADVAVFSYETVPKGRLADRYLDQPPQIVFEVLSPSDRGPQAMTKVGEYLDAGVRFVCLVDSRNDAVTVFNSDATQQKMQGDDQLAFEDVLPGFSMTVGDIFGS